ncbi:MAG: hypothetical protein IJU77_03770 [Butyrivibrio sp.]|nr:hypothetical protein [Butyrivibrio sp.]
MSKYETVSFENRKYLARWISVNGKVYLAVDESIKEKIMAKRRNKRALKAIPDPNLMIFTSVDMMFENEDTLRDFAEMQLIETAYHKALA